MSYICFPVASVYYIFVALLLWTGKKVVRLEYEGYVPMAELELKKICSQVNLSLPYRVVRTLSTEYYCSLVVVQRKI